MEYTPENWLITFDDFKKDIYGNTFGDGRPFGDGTEMAERAQKNPPEKPWDEGCIVEPLIGGYDTMKAIRETFEKVIEEAKDSAKPFGSRGHVYIAGWRLNPNRDMSENVDPWHESSSVHAAGTAYGLIRRMMEAGVKVHILLWLPGPWYLNLIPTFREHINAHIYTARLIRDLNQQLKSSVDNLTVDVGVVFLDRRLAERTTLKLLGQPFNSHHQKFIVVRGLKTNVAFCGGVDLAYTRRDAPVDDKRHFYGGDWQSGSDIPPHYYQIDNQSIGISEKRSGSDLPEAVYRNNRQIWHDQHLKLQGPIVSTLEHIFIARWCTPPIKSDHHMVLKDDEDVSLKDGAVISSSDNAFSEEIFIKEFDTSTKKVIVIDNHEIIPGSLEVYEDSPEVYEDSSGYRIDGYRIDVIWDQINPERPYFIQNPPTIAPTIVLNYLQVNKITVKYKKIMIKALPEPEPVDEITDSRSVIVQPWQTIPLRERALGKYGENAGEKLRQGRGVPYKRGEFSVMAGIAKACKAATQMVLIFDQYFWSVPYAKLLARVLAARDSLYLIIVLPPISDQSCNSIANHQHYLRCRALLELDKDDIRDRIRVYSLWNDQSEENGGWGIYCHAKVQMFDDALLVCGSSNINRRSYTSDTELTCAVMNRRVVQDHYKSLWEYLFLSPFPITFEEEKWGEELFHEFQQTNDFTKEPEPKTILDPWRSLAQLPNGVVRYNYLDEPLTNNINNPSGLDSRVGRPVKTTNLSDIVERIEKDSKAFRKQ